MNKFYLRIVLMQRTEGSGPNPEFASQIISIKADSLGQAKVILLDAVTALIDGGFGV